MYVCICVCMYLYVSVQGRVQFNFSKCDPFSRELLGDYGKGHLPAYKLFRYSSTATESASRATPTFGLFSKHRSRSKYDPHAERNLNRILGSSIRIRPYFIRVPLQCQYRVIKRKMVCVARHTFWDNVPIVLPWEVVMFLQRNGRESASLVPDEEELRLFWHHFGKLPYCARHSVHQRLGADGWINPGEVVPWPCHIHVDGVRIYKSSGRATENICWNWSSAVVKGSCRYSKFWFSHVPLHLYTKDTNHFMVAAARWVLRVLATGVTPRCGMYFEKIPDRHPPGVPFRPALFCGLKTDAKERRVQHMATKHNGARRCCQQCCAETRAGPLCYKDMSDDAPHRRTELSHRFHVRNTAPDKLTPWASFNDFVIEMHRDCSQHILYQEGVASFVVAGTLKVLLVAGWFGDGSLQDGLERAFVSFCNSPEGKKDSHRPAPFTFRRLRLAANRFPRMAATYKHGQIRAFLWWASSQASAALGPASSQYFRTVVLCVCSLAAFVQFLDSRPVVLTTEDRSVAFQLGRAFRNAWTTLVETSRLNRDFTWGMTPKGHQFDHQISHLVFSNFNPLFQWSCWQEEGFMEAAASVTKKVSAMHVGLARALQRWIVWLHAEFEGA